MTRFSSAVALVALFVSQLLAQAPLAAATHPVSVGLNANWEQGLARSANVGWVRIDLNWADVNPQSGVWDFTVPDARVSESRANGQQILAILHVVPAWAGGGARGNIPPLTTTGWSEFVRRVAQRYSGQIAAYEIWNEPNDSGSSSTGIGWDRSVSEPPLYVDFLKAAAQEIDMYSPGSLVVGPAFTSRLDTSNKQNRASAILSQVHQAFYPGWDGFCCCFPSNDVLDVLSFHNNGHDTTSSLNTALELKHGSLSYTHLSAPCMATLKPVWVTEYGWRANAVGESGQREKICNITKMYTGRLEASSTSFDQWDINRSFIYLQKDPGTSQAIFRSDNSPTPTVTQYLRAMAYPVSQPPALSNEFPACTGVQTLTVQSLETADQLDAELASRGLGSPLPALPADYRFEGGEVDGGTIIANFAGPGSDHIRVRVVPADSPVLQGSLSEASAEWTNGSVRIEILRSLASAGPAGLVARIASTMDRTFGSQCLRQEIRGDATAVRRLGLRAPAAPKGFAAEGASLATTEATRGCGSRAGLLRDFDLVWTFRNESGEKIQAGIYRYGDSFDGEAVKPTSLHWSGSDHTRYWVAVVESPNPSNLKSSLYEVARSMDPSLGLKAD